MKRRLKDVLLVTRSTPEEAKECNYWYFRLESVKGGEATIVRDSTVLVAQSIYHDLIDRLNYRGFDAKWTSYSHNKIKVNCYMGFSLII